MDNLKNLSVPTDDRNAINRNTIKQVAIHKFGGSSLATAQRLKNVVKIIKSHSNEDDLIVVSANGKITDQLVEITRSDRKARANLLEQIGNYYRSLVNEVISETHILLSEFITDQSQIINGRLSNDEILAFGEIWSARLLSELLNQEKVAAQFTDARMLLKTDSIECFENFSAEYFELGLKKHRYGNYQKRLVVTGFIASDLLHKTITLGRNGSDYSASLLAYFVKAQQVTLWTDVSGIFSADPRLVSSARPIKSLTYDEAKALSAIGSNVLHQKTIEPLQKANIPLRVKASLQPDETGTLVSASNRSATPISSIALKTDLVKISLNKLPLSEQMAILHDFFEHHIVVITAATSEIEEHWAVLVSREYLRDASEILLKRFLPFNVDKQCYAVIAIVGNQLNERVDFIDYLQQQQLQDGRFQSLISNNIHELKFVSNVADTTALVNALYNISFNYFCARETWEQTAHSDNAVLQEAVA